MGGDGGGGAATGQEDPGAATASTTLAHILPSQQAPKGTPRVVVLGSGWAGFQLVRGFVLLGCELAPNSWNDN